MNGPEPLVELVRHLFSYVPSTVIRHMWLALNDQQMIALSGALSPSERTRLANVMGWETSFPELPVRLL